MAIRSFDFKCSNEHKQEYFVDSLVKTVECEVCGDQAHRVVSTPNFKLDGITGAFPTAADKWARIHEQASAVANKKHLEHGSL